VPTLLWERPSGRANAFVGPTMRGRSIRTAATTAERSFGLFDVGRFVRRDFSLTRRLFFLSLCGPLVLPLGHCCEDVVSRTERADRFPRKIVRGRKGGTFC
jgi:hypothetical protein